MVAADPRYSPFSRRLIMIALVQNAGPVLSVLSTDERAQTHSRLDLEKLRAALAAAPCEVMCQL
jgi:hypothetical protein